MDCRPEIRFISVKNVLSPSRLPGLNYALNPYIGCQHGCLYCYAPNYTYIDDIRKNWGKIVYVKENLIDVLPKEALRKPKGTVGVGTITDAYQPIESIYKLSRASIRNLLSHGFKISIQTKSSLLLRDTDIYTKYKSSIDIGFTITTSYDYKAKIIEPCSAPPSQRMKTLKILSEMGISVWAFIGPMIMWNDIEEFSKDVEQILMEIGNYVDYVYYDQMRLKPNIYSINNEILAMFIKSARKKEQLISHIIKLCDKYGVKCIPAFFDTGVYKLSF